MTLPLQLAEQRDRLSGSDRALLDGWNDTRTNYPKHASIAELFEEQARHTPHAVALAFGGERISYAQLNARANCVARHLRKLGVQHEELVGVCLDRSVEMIVAILATLKAGAAYVPLDAEYPREQLDYMVADTRARVILTQKALAAGALSHLDKVLVALDDPAPVCSREDDIDFPSVAGARSLAYVMYTSGSTGRPKGVMVEQRSVIHLVRDTNYCHFGPNESFLQLAPISFDAATLEIWGPLLNGGRLVIMPAETASLDQIGHALAEHNVTSLWLTAGLFHLMVEQRLNDLRPLRQLLAGGDVLSPWHVEQVLRAHPHLRLINGYGPTEGTTFTCCHTFDPSVPVPDPVPIGRPISNTRVHILDSEFQPTKIGDVGELFIGGDGVARCYWNMPELTAAKFVECATGPDGAMERLYRTGDEARFSADGVVQFLGRRDNQVKMRGHRIELEEIESALRRHASVRQACVVAEREGAAVKRLIAYCVAAEDRRLDPAILRESLQNFLPPHMMPAAFVTLPSLPLTANGKVDRAALSAAAGHETAEATATVSAPGENIKTSAVRDEIGRASCRERVSNCV